MAVYNILKLKQLLNNGTLVFGAAVMVVVIMPLYIWYSPPFMVAWGVLWIMQCWSNNDFRTVSFGRYRLLLFFFVTFYLWQLIGVFYSENVKLGWSMLFTRFSFLLFPLVFTTPGNEIEKRGAILLKLFAGSTTLNILICFGYAIYRSISVSDGILTFNPHPPEAYWMSFFYGTLFSINQHPSYLSMYVIISAFISLESWSEHKPANFLRHGWLFLALLLFVSLYLLSSRSGLIAAAILIPVYFFSKIRAKWTRTGIIVAASLLFVVSVLMVSTNERMRYAISEISKGSIKQLVQQDGRVAIWQSSLHLIRENLIFGVGTGDVRQELVKEYSMQGEENLVINQYNAHNQFLEVLLENGLIGLLIFGSLIILMIRIAINERRLLYGLFIIMILIFFLFETVLNRLWGVSFFSLFSFLILYSTKSINKKNLD
jgi:O-antigen ligase